LSFRTLPYKGFSAFLQFQNVADLGASDQHNNLGAGDLSNGITDRPPIADPAQTRFQQVYLRVDAFDTAIDLGRREITYGDHRFIGNVGWRQNHQTFDAIYLLNRSFDKAALSYSFADNVVKVNGAEQAMSSHFVNGLLNLRPDISAELFGYFLDFDDRANYGLSSKTFGFRLLGNPVVSEDLMVNFELEYANQSDLAGNPDSFSANYLELMGGIAFRDIVNVKVGRERLGDADGAQAFQTPLATLHKFNGWADKFLATPANGLVDWYLSFNGKIQDLSWLLAYHDFGADSGGSSYGTEWDVQVTYPMPWKQLLGAKVAMYREDGFSTDTTKFWLWTHYAF
jgi:hypothetical protein